MLRYFYFTYWHQLRFFDESEPWKFLHETDKKSREYVVERYDKQVDSIRVELFRS